MSGVMIDIPNIGNIEAKNAATEATLKEILKALLRVQRDINSKEQDNGKDEKNGKGDGKEATRAQKLGVAFGVLAYHTKNVAAGFGAVAKSAIDLIDDLAGVGDSLTSAASSLRSIPIVGGALAGVFGAVAGAAEGVARSFNDAASSGATFGGSINQFSRSASAAGMTMTEFGSLIKSNGEGLLGFGKTTEEGAKRFAQVSKTLRTTSSDLYALGFSSQTINQGLATYGNMLRMQGLQGRQSNAQLVSGAQKYLKELDALAKITGVERSAKEAEIMNALKDAQFQGAMATKSKEVRDSFISTLGGLAGGMQGPLGNFAKDILATGTATTDENQKLMAMMPASAKMLQDLRAKMNRGEAVTEAERNRLNNLMATEGAKSSKQMGQTFAAAPEFAGTMNALTLAQSMQKDAVKSATAEQEKAVSQTDKQNEAIQKSKQSLAEFSNSFQMALVNSGLLEGLMTTFKTLANFVGNVIVPIFQTLAPVLTSAINIVAMALTPAMRFLAGAVKDYVIPTFFAVSDFIEDNFIPVLTGALIAIGPVIYAYISSLKAATVAKYKTIKAELAKLTALGPFLLLAAAVAGIVYIFKKLGGDMAVFTNGLKYFMEGFKSLFSFIKLGFATLINKLSFGALGGDMIKEANAELKDQATEREKLLNESLAKMKENRESASKEDEKKSKLREARDKKIAEAKFGAEKKGISEVTAAEKAAIEERNKPSATEIDYASPEATAKSFFAQQKSPLAKAEPTKKELEVKKPLAKAEPTKKEIEVKKPLANAEATKKELEAKGTAKTAEEDRSKKEAEQKRNVQKTLNAEVESGSNITNTTDLHLIEISKSMAELVRINKTNARIMEKQLGVQESFSGDVWANPSA